MPKTMLVTRPNFDDATEYLSYWAQESIKFAKGRGLNILDLPGKKTVKRVFVNFMKKHNPNLIFFNGHGENDLITSHKYDLLVKVGVNEQILSSKVVYALACSAGAVLGPKSVEKGASAFIGYDSEFLFHIDENNPSTPIKDKYAKYFLGPSKRIINTLIKRGSPEEAYIRGTESFRKNILKLLDNRTDPDFKILLPELLSDMLYLKVYQ